MIKIKSISDVISNSSNEAFILRCRDHDSYDIFKGYFKDVIQQFATEHGLDDLPGKKMPFKVYRASVSSADNPNYNEGNIYWNAKDIVLQVKETSGLMWDIQDLLNRTLKSRNLDRAGISWTDPVFVADGEKL